MPTGGRGFAKIQKTGGIIKEYWRLILMTVRK